MDTKCVICEVGTEVLYMIYIMKRPGHEPLGGLDAKTYHLPDRLTLTWLNLQVIIIRKLYLYWNRNTCSKYKFPATI